VHGPTRVSAAADFTFIPRAIAIAEASRLLPVTAVGSHSEYDQKKINLFYCTRPATVFPPLDDASLCSRGGGEGNGREASPNFSVVRGKELTERTLVVASAGGKTSNNQRPRHPRGEARLAPPDPFLGVSVRRAPDT
jgi:hypothetical protein